MIVRLYNAFPSLSEFESEQENSVAKVFWFVLLPGNVTSIAVVNDSFMTC